MGQKKKGRGGGHGGTLTHLWVATASIHQFCGRRVNLQLMRLGLLFGKEEKRSYLQYEIEGEIGKLDFFGSCVYKEGTTGKE